jgi:hypothetical protein
MENLESNYIRQHYATQTAKDIAAHLNIPISRVYRLAAAMGLKKPIEAIRQMSKDTYHLSGIKTQFGKGHIPWNKGIKTDGSKIPSHTKFQKGQMPKNYLPVGWSRIDADGYHWMKVNDPNVWKMIHVITWQNENGPVPDGKIVIFKDGNRSNLDIENLILVDRKEHMLRNSIQRYPMEVQQSLKAISKLKKIIKNHGKEQN